MVRTIFLAGLSLAILCLASVAAPAPLERKAKPPQIESGKYQMWFAEWGPCNITLYGDGHYVHDHKSKAWTAFGWVTKTDIYTGVWLWDKNSRILHMTDKNLNGEDSNNKYIFQLLPGKLETEKVLKSGKTYLRLQPLKE